MSASILPASIILADGHPITLKGLEHLLAEDSTFNVLASCSDGTSTLAAINQQIPEILLLDLYLPDQGGLGVLYELLKLNHKIKIIIFANHIEDEVLCEIIRIGVRGALLKNTSLPAILKYLGKILHGEECLEKKSVQSALETLLRGQKGQPTIFQQLSPRELELAQLVATGLSNKNVAQKMYITEGSVKISLNRIYAKLQLKNRVELSCFLQQYGLISS